MILLHNRRVERYEVVAFGAFRLPVAGRSEGSGRLVAVRVSHLLHPADHHHIVHAAGDGHHPPAHRRGARTAGRFRRRRVHPAQARRIGHQRAQMLLLAQDAGQHVAYIQGIDALDTRVGQRSLYRVRRQPAHRQRSLLSHRGLTNTEDVDVTHWGAPCEWRWQSGGWRVEGADEERYRVSVFDPPLSTLHPPPSALHRMPSLQVYAP